MRRIVLAAEPLHDGPTALRPWRDSDIHMIAYGQLAEEIQGPDSGR